MTPEEFRNIRETLELSSQKMAEFLGLKSGRMIRYYEAGQKPIPEWIIKFLALYNKKDRG